MISIQKTMHIYKFLTTTLNIAMILCQTSGEEMSQTSVRFKGQSGLSLDCTNGPFVVATFDNFETPTKCAMACVSRSWRQYCHLVQFHKATGECHLLAYHMKPGQARTRAKGWKEYKVSGSTDECVQCSDPWITDVVGSGAQYSISFQPQDSSETTLVICLPVVTKVGMILTLQATHFDKHSNWYFRLYNQITSDMTFRFGLEFPPAMRIFSATGDIGYNDIFSLNRQFEVNLGYMHDGFMNFTLDGRYYGKYKCDNLLGNAEFEKNGPVSLTLLSVRVP